MAKGNVNKLLATPAQPFVEALHNRRKLTLEVVLQIEAPHGAGTYCSDVAR